MKQGLGCRVKGTVASFVALLIFLTPNPYTLTPTYAADATPSSSIKSKLKDLQDQIASKAAKIQQEVNKKLQNKAFIGAIKSKSSDEISLTTKDGEKKVLLTELTEYYPKSTKFTLASLKEGEFIVALGDVDNEGSLLGKRIIKTASSSAKKVIYYGTVLSKPLKIRTPQGETISINTTSKTKYKFETQDVGLTEVKETKPIIVVGTTDKEIFTARFIYILPYTTNLKIATDSAKISTSSTKKK